MAKTREPKQLDLNPFCFPAETNYRFLLLVMIVAGTTVGLGFLLVRYSTGTGSDLVAVLPGLGLALFVFAYAWIQSGRDAMNKIRKQGWKPFPPPDRYDESEQSTFQQMSSYIGQIVATVPGIAANQLDFVWDDTDTKITGRAFGFRKKQFICLQAGFFTAFVMRQLRPFYTVLLHELGHIANRDVNKTIFTIVLGKCFLQTAVIGLALLNLILFYDILHRLGIEGSLVSIWDGIMVLVLVNIKLLLLLLLIEILRSSVLRVREYYADARARIWLGRVSPLVETILRASKQNNGDKPSWRQKIWHLFRYQLWAWLVPQHPSSIKRVSVLTDVRELFRPSKEAAFFAGLATGLVLNSNWIILMPLIEMLDGMVSKLDSLPVTSGNVIIMAGVLLTLVTALFVVLVIFGLLPIIGVIGGQIQMAAFADHIQPSSQRLLPMSTLVSLVFIFSASMIIGFMLSPIQQSFSMPGRALFLAPVYLLGLMGIFLAWAFPLRWLAARLYSAHSGEQPPVFKRKCLTFLSGLALFPLFIAMSFSQIMISVLVVDPTQVISSGFNLASLIVGVWFIALVIFGAVWVVGWFILFVFGWLNQTQPPVIPTWATRPAPCPFPTPPAPKISAARSGPPPL